MTINDVLKLMVEKNGSDLFYRAGGIPRLRVDGKIITISDKTLSIEDVLRAVEEMTTQHQRDMFKNNVDLEFAYFLDDIKHRFRVSVFRQRNWPSIVIRNIQSDVPDFDSLNLPGEVLRKLAEERRGLVLLTGSTGSGKSTTIASMIEHINNTSCRHILTVEEPVEYTFKDNKCLINQRELGLDVTSYSAALKSFALQSPDVIYIGNIRDHETMSAALTAAETGVLVLSTLHTINASQTVERVTNFFPPHQHGQVRMQLSYLLKGVISLRLIPLKDSAGRIPAYEIMLLTPTIGRLIREGKTWEIPQFIEEGSIFGMQSFNQSLLKLVKANKISEEEALTAADNKEDFMLALRGIKKA